MYKRCDLKQQCATLIFDTGLCYFSIGCDSAREAALSSGSPLSPLSPSLPTFCSKPRVLVQGSHSAVQLADCLTERRPNIPERHTEQIDIIQANFLFTSAALPIKNRTDESNVRGGFFFGCRCTQLPPDPHLSLHPHSTSPLRLH
ncbi:UNVERIFIED_CONTAM: hypothetical protein FKN15_007993 [Acipenser sinensis]